MNSRTISKWVPVITLMLAAGPGQANAAGARVCFLVTDAFGTILPYTISDFRGTGGVRNGSPDACISEVSRGVYRYELQHSTVQERTLAGKLFVEGDDVLVVQADTRIIVTDSAGVPFATDAISPKTLDVRFTGTRTRGKRYWVRVTSLFGIQKFTFPLNDEGRAERRQRWLGKYLVIVFADGDLIGIRQIEFRQSTSRISVHIGSEAQEGTVLQK